MRTWTGQGVVAAVLALAFGCGDDGGPAVCEVGEDPEPSRATIDCWEQFELQAARPLDSALPGALTIKTIIDQPQDDQIHFLDTSAYPFHQAFAVEYLAWPPGQPFVSEYLYPQRRFLLGAVTYFAEPDVWTYELAPYDTSTAEMITKAVELLAGASYFGDQLRFHPVSREQEQLVGELPEHIGVITTEEIYADLTYQPLNLAETVAQVRILTVDELADTYVSPRELVVLDQVPNDISVVAGVVTEAFQTPLSHVNVLSQQRGTPNMGLRGARDVFAEHDGKWVKLVVGAFDYQLSPVTQSEADAWWEDNRPTPVEVADPDGSVRLFVDLDGADLADIPAIGGKAAHYAELRKIEGPRVRDAFAIPVHFYQQFMADNGFAVRVDGMLADEQFRSDGNHRRMVLAQLQQDMLAAPLNSEFLATLEARLASQFPDRPIRFRSSTNAEDLNGFSGAGRYQSAGGEVGDPDNPVDEAVKIVWASLWNFRAFEERDYVSIDHHKVAMAVLVHPSFRDESANGVAISANIFDPEPGGEDAFYVNVQAGAVSVVQPPDSTLSADQLVYYFFHNNQPATYYTHSSLVADGDTVLTRRELFELGQALDAIRGHFEDSYDPPPGYGRLPMDVEFKRMPPGGAGSIWIKQARPYPGRGGAGL